MITAYLSPRWVPFDPLTCHICLCTSCKQPKCKTTVLPLMEKHLIFFKYRCGSNFKSNQHTPKGMKPVQLIEEDLNQTQLEIVKAVAQAWHGHINRSPTNTREAEPCIHKFKARPSRFKMERLKHLSNENSKEGDAAAYWDFGQSLWDSYEVITLSKKLDDGMVLDQAFAKPYSRNHSVGRKREHANSLRFLFDHMSSRRFSEPEYI